MLFRSANTWDYGPLGMALKNNIKQAWLKKFVQENKYKMCIRDRPITTASVIKYTDATTALPIDGKRYLKYKFFTLSFNKMCIRDSLIAELESIKGNEDEIYDRFYKALTFGTAGLRGVIGAGTNRMNIYVVQMCIRDSF